MSVELRALFEIHRQQTLLLGQNADGTFRFPTEYVYAVSERLCPIFNEEWCQGEDPFEALYDPTRDFMEDVISTLLDASNNSQGIPTFYELERKYGHEKRVELMNILRYAHLAGQLDSSLLSQVLKPGDHPTEATRIIKPLLPSDLTIVY